jgi:hypothetical protein
MFFPCISIIHASIEIGKFVAMGWWLPILELDK